MAHTPKLSTVKPINKTDRLLLNNRFSASASFDEER